MNMINAYEVIDTTPIYLSFKHILI